MEYQGQEGWGRNQGWNLQDPTLTFHAVRSSQSKKEFFIDFMKCDFEMNYYIYILNWQILNIEDLWVGFWWREARPRLTNCEVGPGTQLEVWKVTPLDQSEPELEVWNVALSANERRARCQSWANPGIRHDLLWYQASGCDAQVPIHHTLNNWKIYLPSDLDDGPLESFDVRFCLHWTSNGL